MDTIELRTKAKITIDEIFNEVEELKIKSEQVEKHLKSEWEQELKNIENGKDSLKGLYDKIAKTNEESTKELAAAFEDEKANVQKRIEHLQEIYSKKLN